MNFSFENYLACPDCHHRLDFVENFFKCRACAQIYPIQGRAIIFRAPEKKDQLVGVSVSENRESVVLRFKEWAKKFPGLFNLLYVISAPFVGKSAKKMIAPFPKKSFILNIGSGVKQVGLGVINLDQDCFFGVDLVADAEKLPIADATVDLVVAESVFEHVLNPIRLVNEIHRVLKPEGQLYVVVPFMLGYHASPHDYYRWTQFGMEELLKDFLVTETGQAWGPTTALTSVLGRWLSLVLSFGNRQAYQLFLVAFIFILAPFNLLDYIIGRHPMAIDNAHGLYFVARKK